MESKQLTIALAGNPNSGKTTIFNNITGTRQKTGNWPGVTVEKKEGIIHCLGHRLRIIDLPGTYSLTPFSIEEIVARDFIIEERPDVVIDIIDASNLERSLYLATQLRETDCRVLFALNMADMAHAKGMRINAHKLSELLDLPVVFTIGNRNDGIEELLKAAVALGQSEKIIPPARKVKYSRDIEAALSQIQQCVTANSDASLPCNPRWVSVKLLENDPLIQQRLSQATHIDHDAMITCADDCRQKLIKRFDEDPEIMMTDERYGFIAGIVKEVVQHSRRHRIDISRNIDRVLTDRFLGFPIFIFFIWAMFQLTFSLGVYPMDWIDTAVTLLSTRLDAGLPDSWLKYLLVDGILAGVGSVVIFLPNILLLFFCIALFEDTGYMARAAFLMDKIMHLIGLHGKSFIPMLMGFGCSVPAIMATRTLENRKDRILTIMITPFMSCSARLPVYIVLAGAFFGSRAGSVIFGIYLLGIGVSIITGRLFRNTLLTGEDAPFVMELPPYRVPMLKNLLIHMWDRSKMFLKKMGGIILIGSMVVWVLSTYPQSMALTEHYRAQIQAIETQSSMQPRDAAQSAKNTGRQAQVKIQALETQMRIEQTEHTFIGRIGKFLAPVFAPIGIDWRGGVALLTGFVAKEIVISTLSVLHAVDKEDSQTLGAALKRAGMTPLSALSMMIFVLLYVPCLATVASIRRETGSWKWAGFNIAYTTAIAWLFSFMVYQGGRLIGLA